MSRLTIYASLAVLVLPVSVQAQDGEPRLLAPSSAWSLDYAEEKCSLVREFGEGVEALRLQIDSFGSNARGYRVMLSGDLFAQEELPVATALSLAYSSDREPRDSVTATVGRFGDSEAIVFWRGFVPQSGSGGAFVEGLEHITLALPEAQPLRLALGEMEAPFDAMHDCLTNLVNSWGIDTEALPSLSRPASIAELSENSRQLDLGDSHPGYTERRMRRVARRVVQRPGEPIPSRVIVAASGEPVECVVQVAVAEERAAQICETLTSYSYEPALDAGGEPVIGFMTFETR